jgi:hypothetical protein
MKDFNLHKYLRDNPLTNQTNKLSKGKINEAFEGFGGVKGIAAIGDGALNRDTNFDPTDSADYDEQSQPNTWIADIDRMPDYNGWKASWEHPGLIVWSNEEVPNATVVATPGWDGKGTPVEFQSGGGVSQMLKVLDQDTFPTFKAYLSAIRPYLDMVLDANVNPTSTDYETSDIKAPGMEKFQSIHEGPDEIINKIERWLHTTTEPYADYDFDGDDTVTLYDEDDNEIEKLSVSKDMGITTREGYMGTPYDSSEDMSVDMLKKGIREGLAGMKTLFIMDYQSGKMFSKMVPDNMQSEEIEEMLADEYGMNPNDIYYMITDEAEVQDLDNANIMEGDFGLATHNGDFGGDDSEEEMPSRIEGLVDQRELAKFAQAVMMIAQDLDDEGFDAIDIKKLLKDKLDDMIIA